MENFPLIFEQFFKRILIYALLLATVVIGIPSLIIFLQPQNFKNAINALTHPQNSLNYSLENLSQPVHSKQTQKMKPVEKTPTKLLSMGWLVGDCSQLSNYYDLQVVSPLFATIGSDDQI